MRITALLAGFCVAGALATSAAAQGAPPPPPGMTSYELDVGAGKSQVLETPGVYTDLMVGDPKVADVVPLTTHSVYVVGKSVGATSLSIYGPGKRLIATVDVVVDPDIADLQTRLREIIPEEKDIAMRMSNDSLVISGTVSSPVALHRVVELAETYAPGKVINMLGVEGAEQVQLEVRFVEMERSTAKALSVGVSRTSVTGNPQFNFNSGPATLGNAGGIGSIGGLVGTPGFASLGFHTPDGTLTFTLDALETKGVIKTLADPTLVAMSGEQASFLAGGEIPIPSAQAGGLNNIITVQYQPFGISLGFTPTILDGGMINLIVKPEVSSIDSANSVTLNGITIPGLKIRRASTTVELRDGESFVIAGLLSDSYQNQISAFPLLGDIPVLGALFRSPSYQRDQTELVVVITPHLVVARRGPIALPTDHFTPPSDYELFLFGMLAGQGANIRPEDRALMSQDPAKGGVEGPYGHVLY
ncbi:MAG TPA: type II and III secretion system protein family protein [Caulobacteraceae bacterium]